MIVASKAGVATIYNSDTNKLTGVAVADVADEAISASEQFFNTSMVSHSHARPSSAHHVHACVAPLSPPRLTAPQRASPRLASLSRH